jgi:hypothetical protein
VDGGSHITLGDAPGWTGKLVSVRKNGFHEGEQEIREIWRSKGTVVTNSPDA